IRELYVDFGNDLPNGDIMSWRRGNQHEISGRNDLFSVLDVINPVDFTRNNINDQQEDIRIPMWNAKRKEEHPSEQQALTPHGGE
ncbi:hypothetical protein ACMFY5_26275, partial [Pseudomonas sihuiensis]